MADIDSVSRQCSSKLTFSEACLAFPEQRLIILFKVRVEVQLLRILQCLSYEYLKRSFSLLPFLFSYLTVVLQVSLLPKGFSRNFTFTEQEGTGEVARITLPPYLFQEQGIMLIFLNNYR